MASFSFLDSKRATMADDNSVNTREILLISLGRHAENISPPLVGKHFTTTTEHRFLGYDQSRRTDIANHHPPSKEFDQMSSDDVAANGPANYQRSDSDCGMDRGPPFNCEKTG